MEGRNVHRLLHPHRFSRLLAIDNFIGRHQATERPSCLACGRAIVGPPDERTVSQRGPIETVVDWHICACGALARLEQIRRADSQPKVRHRSEPLGSAIDRKPGDAEPWVTIGFFGNASGRDRRDATLRPELGDELASIVAPFRLAEQEPAKVDLR